MQYSICLLFKRFWRVFTMNKGAALSQQFLDIFRIGYFYYFIQNLTDNYEWDSKNHIMIFLSFIKWTSIWLASVESTLVGAKLCGRCMRLTKKNQSRHMPLVCYLLSFLLLFQTGQDFLNGSQASFSSGNGSYLCWQKWS